MKVTHINLVDNDDPDTFAPKPIIASMAFRDPTTTRSYVAKGIAGLDADEIVPMYYGRNAVSNQRFYELSLNEREVVLKIALKPQLALGETYSSLRDNLYRHIQSRRSGLMEIQFLDSANPSVVNSLYGLVTKLESNLFDPEPDVTLTIECENGWIREKGETLEVPGGTTVTQFPTITDNISTAPHGFQFEIMFTGVNTSFTIQSGNFTVPEWKFKVTPGFIGAASHFQAGDHLYFSSEPGNKFLYMTRAGFGSVILPLVDRLEAGAVWPIIFPGVNSWWTVSTTSFTFTGLPSLTHHHTYWGV